jgi:hypothetical protein
VTEQPLREPGLTTIVTGTRHGEWWRDAVGCDDGEMDALAAVDARLVRLVCAYSQRVRRAVLAQHERASVYSPVGIWVLLCAALLAADGFDRERLERAVGCSGEEAGELLGMFVGHVPEALKAAVAVWARSGSTTDAFGRWTRKLPAGVESGPMPSQSAADDWAQRNTLGLIESFPINVDEMLVVLGSAVATRVSWVHPFEIASARERFSPASPWRDELERVLSTGHTIDAAIVDSEDAGIVAVFEAVAQEDLTVVCVSADPAVSRERVFDAAHEIVAHIGAGAKLSARSLFSLPLGEAHSWSITERERPARRSGQRFEAIADVALPSWQINSKLNLLADDAFAAGAATAVLRTMMTESGPASAEQVALATFDRYGFKAAAITLMGGTVSETRPLEETGLERTARLRFDHPFAAIAVSGRPGTPRATSFRGLPLFEGWVDSPTEAESDRPAT